MSETNNIEFRVANPIATLADFVESFWMLKNVSDEASEVVVLPDGRFDIIFHYTSAEPFTVMQMGLGTKPDKNTISSGFVMFAISFKLLAIEYLLDTKAAVILDNAQALPTDFWGVNKDDLNDFDEFCEKVSARMLTLIKPGIDIRKKNLFDLIYSSNGSLTVKELSEKVGWSSRQINRYFNSRFGISLKTYCNIIRFKTSLHHIKEGRLFPELNFTDQTHFIKEVKKYSGALPKQLYKNDNGKFILLSSLAVK